MWCEGVARTLGAMPFQLQRVDNVPPILSHIWFLLKELLLFRWMC